MSDELDLGLQATEASPRRPNYRIRRVFIAVLAAFVVARARASAVSL